VKSPRTKLQVDKWLVEYEKRNKDLLPRDRRLLGLFALSAMRKVPTKLIEDLLGYESTTLRRDISRRWWLVLFYSGASQKWKQFKMTAEKDGVPEAWRWLSNRVTAERRDLLIKRLGMRPWRATMAWRKKNLKPDGRSRAVKGNMYWFKAGTWSKNSPWTMLVIEGKSLASRRAMVGRHWESPLAPHVRLLEKECKYHINPDKTTPQEAKRLIVAFLKRRIKEILGWRHVTNEVVAWFLTAQIPTKDALIDFKDRPGRSPKYGRTRRQNQLKERARAWR